MTNHGGCAILNEMITYPDRKETRKKFQKTGMPWWSNEKANLLLVPIFSAMDGTVLYYETRINNVCCIRGRISSCLWWDSVSALRI